MDLAYDHIQEEVLDPADQSLSKAPSTSTKASHPAQEANLNTEFQEAYKSFSASPWGARLGGFLNTVKKQGETYYEGAKQEAGAVGGEAVKGFTDLKSTLVSRARSMSAGQSEQTKNVDPFGGDDEEGVVVDTPKAKAEGNTTAEKEATSGDGKTRTESQISNEDSSGFISRFRSEATKRLQDIQKAEDAADEALLRFGTNISNFLKDAVTVTAPSLSDAKGFANADGTKSKVLWESKAPDGKRVQHATRFDAQLHAIHSSPDSFTKDPVSPEYESWTKEFDIEKRTEGISKDLEQYAELKRAMERLVPEKVEYGLFWMRYYFLRMVVEEEEKRRRELLKDAANPTAPLPWDDDSDSETSSPTPQQLPQPTTTTTTSDDSTYPTHPGATHQSNASTTTIKPPKPTATTTPAQEDPTQSSASLKPTDTPSRRSQDQNSQDGGASDASYDIVSGATSRGLPSPKEGKEGKVGEGPVDDDDDEPDWE